MPSVQSLLRFTRGRYCKEDSQTKIEGDTDGSKGASEFIKK